MKQRNGFVSNSSSSSFVCDICGEVYEGWDASPHDDSYDCSVCPNEHIMCNEHIVGEIKSPMMNGCDHEFDRTKAEFCSECGEPAAIENEDYTLSSDNCPICQFEDYSESEMAKYLEKTRGITRVEVFEKVKSINKRRKKLRNPEYITYVCEKFSLTDKVLLKEIKDKFGTFDNYAKFLRSK
jgi:hypothetical protein